MDFHEIIIIGSGPAGLSAGARAADHGISHLILERSDQLCDTVVRYQKNKLIMATPYALPARGAIGFQEGSREEVLARWEDETRSKGVNFRLNAEVTSIEGKKGNFTIELANGEKVRAANVVLAIGVQGNKRQLDIPGGDWSGLQYNLDDPDDHFGETIAIVGAGDSGLENALALADQNEVILINRNADLARATKRNQALALEKINRKSIIYYDEATPVGIENGHLHLEVKSGTTKVACDRVIARLGAQPPRDFLQDIGIEFAGELGQSPPAVGERYESSVAGIYIIGSLGGYPLIKHALNQGYEVVDFISGRDTPHADEDLLLRQLAPIVEGQSLARTIDGIRSRIGLVADFNKLQLREFLLDVTVREYKPGELVFREGEYGDSIYLLYQGSASARIDANPDSPAFDYPEGGYCGEIGLMAGRRRVASVVATAPVNKFLEVSRGASLKWCATVESMMRMIERSTIIRELRVYLSLGLSDSDLAPVLDTLELRNFKAGDFIYRAGDDCDGIYVIRKGAVTVSKEKNGKSIVSAYLPAGNYLGEISLLNATKRTSDVNAAVECRTIFIPAATFEKLVASNPEFRKQNERNILTRLSKNAALADKKSAGISVDQIVDHKIGEATDLLMVDENLCIRCYNCEKACAETHGGSSRLNLKAGTTVGEVRIPTSCRHCEHPHCMADCPTNSIHRSAGGEVLIDDSCIGCGNCEKNCPYGVIHLEKDQPRGVGALSRFLSALGIGAASEAPATGKLKQLAVKCDMCTDQPTGPACVRACPTGAARRATPENAFDLFELVAR